MKKKSNELLNDAFFLDEQEITLEQFCSLFEHSSITLHPSLGILQTKNTAKDPILFLYDLFRDIFKEEVDFIDSSFCENRRISFGLFKGNQAISLRIFLERKCILQSFLSVS